MNKTIIIFIVLILFSCKSSYTKIGDKDANYIPYYLKVYEADSLYIIGNYEKSYKILDSLFKKYEPINIDSYNEYLIFIKLKVLKNKNIKKDLIKLIQEFGYYEEILNSDSILKYKLIENDINENKIRKLEKIYLKKIDLLTRKIISEMDFEDIKSRSLKKDVLITDKKNDSILRYIILNNKFPNQKYTGKNHIGRGVDNYNGLGLILNHLARYDDSYVFYKHNLFPLLKMGLCPPDYFASLIDKKSVFKNNEPYYFSKYLLAYDITKYDIKIINKRRDSIGLSSIEQEKMWYKKMNINLN